MVITLSFNLSKGVSSEIQNKCATTIKMFQNQEMRLFKCGAKVLVRTIILGFFNDAVIKNIQLHV